MIAEGGTVAVNGNSTTAENNFTGSCGGPYQFEHGEGADLVYQFTLEKTTHVVIQTLAVEKEKRYDTILYLRTECANPDTEVVCDDDSGDGEQVIDQIDVRLQAGTYFLFVDGRTVYGDSGEFSMNLTFE
jgi:hypothetical protein